MTNYIGNTVPGDFYRDFDDNELQRHGPMRLGGKRKNTYRNLFLICGGVALALLATSVAISKASKNLALLLPPRNSPAIAAPIELIATKSPSIMVVGSFFGSANISFSDNGLKDRLAKWIAPGMPPSFIEHSEVSPALVPLAENFFKGGGQSLIVELKTGPRWIPANLKKAPVGFARLFNPNAEFQPTEYLAKVGNFEEELSTLKRLHDLAIGNLGSVTVLLVPPLNFRFSNEAIAAHEEVLKLLRNGGLQVADFGGMAKVTNPLMLTSAQLNGWPSEFAHKLAFELLQPMLAGG